ncbi:MAG TPA: beta-N-acetylhexosaminidase [Rhodocyclaceae bacterium]|nr:MAG: beta-N-acetylhexosaminidase [Betaproteobacteria bacterium CG2_30_68_42]PJA57427.1 MAG: beta-N-acetylhexosaminidase [Rhodocyclales bacterium CG_4_9_14_3_um_filter_68_10]HCX32262.1 beta-N-acetylhexosaminidase [Rhodocyclaceae bacterium]
MTEPIPLGRLMLDLASTTLAPEERERLRHPLVAGVILFARNYASPAQLAALTREIHALREPSLLIAVDQEGGRVQRFRDGFTLLPAMAALGSLWERDALAARAAAEALGTVLAGELRAQGVDLSFAPVLDLDYGPSTVIGDRALHRDPEAVCALAGALLDGLARAGMQGVGKHFPGHGWVAADSHVAVPVDPRSLDELEARDILPYRRLAGRLGGVMPAHVIYERCDAMPAGFSAFWLQRVLREELGFRGVVFSDDLSMEGARMAGGIVERAEAADAAGCDVVLVCNAPEAAALLLDRWHPPHSAALAQRLAALVPRRSRPPADDEDHRVARALVAAIPPSAARGRGC